MNQHRRYFPPIVVTQEPYRILCGLRGDDAASFGPQRMVVDMAIKAAGLTPFEVDVALVPEWAQPFDTDGLADRTLKGSLKPGLAYHFRMELDAPHELASAELAALVKAGDVEVLLIGWDTV